MVAKAEIAQAGVEVCDLAMDVAGGPAFFRGSVIERAYRDARVSTIVAGTTEIMREIIAKICIDKIKYPRVEARIAAAETALKGQA